jgi:hypothetical protein
MWCNNYGFFQSLSSLQSTNKNWNLNCFSKTHIICQYAAKSFYIVLIHPLNTFNLKIKPLSSLNNNILQLRSDIFWYIWMRHILRMSHKLSFWLPDDFLFDILILTLVYLWYLNRGAFRFTSEKGIRWFVFNLSGNIFIFELNAFAIFRNDCTVIILDILFLLHFSFHFWKRIINQ